MKNIKKFATGLLATFLLASCATPHEHAFTTYGKDDSQHWTICECGEETEHVDHEYTDEVTTNPTCEDAGVRTFTCECGHSFTRDIEAEGHSWDDGVVTTEPGATTPGVKTYTCGSCGETRTEDINPSCVISLDEETIFEGYSSIFKIEVQSETLGFTTNIEVTDMAIAVKVAVKISDGGDGVFYQPVIGGSTFQWITNEENTGGWANTYDIWYESEATTDTEGNLSVQLVDYEGRKFPAGATIYVAVELIKYTVTKSTEVTYGEGYDVYTIEVLKDTGTFQVALPVGAANKEIIAAVQVTDGMGWLGFLGGSITAALFFRDAWSQGDWWTGYNTWYDFLGTTDANGNFTVEIQKYDTDLVAGTTVNVAVKLPTNNPYTVEKTTSIVVPGYNDVYAITIKEPTKAFELDLVVGAASTEVSARLTVEFPTATYIEPYVNGNSLNWFKGGDGWSHEYGTWIDFKVTTDANGAIALRFADYGTAFPVDGVIYVAVSAPQENGVLVTSTTYSDLAFEGYETTYKIELTKSTGSFEVALPIGDANAAANGVVTVIKPGEADPFYIQTCIGDLGYYYKGGDGWSQEYGKVNTFSATLNAEGKLAAGFIKYDVDFPAGTVIYVAAKQTPNAGYTVYKSNYAIAGYSDVYGIELDKGLVSSGTIAIPFGKVGQSIVGSLTVVFDTTVWVLPKVGGTDYFYNLTDTPQWYRNFGDLENFSATIDENGNFTMEVNGFDGAEAPRGVRVYVGLKAAQDPIVVEQTTDITYAEGFTVYAVKVVEATNAAFQVNVNTGLANTQVTCALTADSEQEYWFCSWVNGLDDFKFFHKTVSYGGNWSFYTKEWTKEFTTTTDAEGNITVHNKDYDVDTIPAGCTIYLAVKAAA